MSFSNSSASYSNIKSENSSPNGAIKNPPLSRQDYPMPVFITCQGIKKKTTKGDTATLFEVVLIMWFPLLNKFTTGLWSVWSNHTLFLTMLDQMKRESTSDRPLLMYSDNGFGKNGLFEMTLTNSNKYSIFNLNGNEDVQHTAQVTDCY
jgi:hypothetical protein